MVQALISPVEKIMGPFENLGSGIDIQIVKRLSRRKFPKF